MNLTWNIIKKDLRRFVWPLAFWAVTGIYLATQPAFVPQVVLGTSSLYLPVISSLIHAIMIVVVIVDMVQVDDPIAPAGFWKTRPISAGRMLCAKLALFAVLFVVIELTMQSGTWLFQDWPGQNLAALSQKVLACVSAILAIAALAACVRKSSHFILLAAGCLVGVLILTNVFDALDLRELPSRPRRGGSAALVPSKIIVAELIGSAVGLAVLLNQYLHRRPAVSFGLLVAGCVAIAYVFEAWVWQIV